MIQSVPAPHFSEVYPHVSKYFQSFYERAKGALTPGALENEIINSERQCYVAVVDGAVKACALSTVSPSGSITLDFCAGDDATDWQQPMIEMFEDWREAQGVPLTVICRTGWVRRLKMRKRGYRETHRVMELG